MTSLMRPSSSRTRMGVPEWVEDVFYSFFESACEQDVERIR